MKCIFVKEKVLGKKPLLIHRPYFASISKISGWINPFLFYSYSFQFQKPFSPRAVFKSGMEILFFPLKFIPRSKAMYLIIKTPFLFWALRQLRCRRAFRTSAIAPFYTTFGCLRTPSAVLQSLMQFIKHGIKMYSPIIDL